MHRLRIVITGLAVLGAATLLSGCAAPSSGSIELPPKNETKWVLPLDEFTWANSSLRDYAEALIERDCYAKKGVDWPVPWQPTERGEGASFSPGMQRIMNEALASKYGYHTAPQTYEGHDAWMTFLGKTNKIASSTPGFDQIMDGCQAESRGALPLPSDDDRDYTVAAASQIYDEAVLSSKVSAAADKWAQCMSAAGYGGIAASPDKMPPNDKAESWGVGIPGTKAGSEEITVASADVACRTSSGWTTALYTEEWKQQANFVKSNSDRLTRIRDEFTKERKMLLDAVAKHAPEHEG